MELREGLDSTCGSSSRQEPPGPRRNYTPTDSKSSALNTGNKSFAAVSLFYRESRRLLWTHSRIRVMLLGGENNAFGNNTARDERNLPLGTQRASCAGT